MKKALFTAIFAFIGSLVVAQERIAVLPFEDIDNVFTQNEPVMFYRRFSNEFSNRNAGRFIIIPRQEVERLVNTEMAFQLTDFSAREKTAEMNRVLNGTQILSGIIARVGNGITISVSLYTYPDLQQLPGGVDLSVANTNELFSRIPELVQNMQNAIAGMGNESGIADNPPVGNSVFNPAMSLYEQLVNATGTVAITVTQNTELPRETVISQASSITLRGDMPGRTILGSGSNFITIERGVILILENITLKGVCVIAREGGTLIMNNASTITGCNGSGVTVFGTFNMNGGDITNNMSGGVSAEGIFTMNSGTIANNTKSNGGGGGIRVSGSNGRFTMNGGNIINNVADYGGGVYIYQGTFTMKAGRIGNNAARSGNGGGIFIGYLIIPGNTFYMQGGIIAGNRAHNNGGGVYLGTDKSIFRMTAGTIAGNIARNEGGGVYIYYGCIFEMTGGTIYGSNGGSNANIADRGNAVYDIRAVFSVRNLTISRYN